MRKRRGGKRKKRKQADSFAHPIVPHHHYSGINFEGLLYKNYNDCCCKIRPSSCVFIFNI